MKRAIPRKTDICNHFRKSPIFLYFSKKEEIRPAKTAISEKTKNAIIMKVPPSK